MANVQKQDLENKIHCAVCVNQGKMVAAITIVKGYASCAQHVELVSKPDFDIFQLKTSKSFT